MSKGEESTGGRNNPSILEDVIESLIGAIYCDGGLEAANLFFNNFILPNAEDIISEDNLKDSKSILQEKVQSKGFTSPLYKTIKESGPDHDKTFEVAVLVNEKEIITGSGKSKQEAEQNAAKKALELI
jgi:ribonuclease-3